MTRKSEPRAPFKPELVAIRTTEPALYVYSFGNDEKGNKRTLIVTQSLLPDLILLDEVSIFVETKALETFKQWIATELVADSAKQMKISRAGVGRLRGALGVQSYQKPGTSKVTAWRKRKKAQALLTDDISFDEEE